MLTEAFLRKSYEMLFWVLTPWCYLCSGPAVRNYNYYSAPPLVGGYGGYGYGGGGISIMPSFGMPLFYGGGIFNFFIVMVSSSQLCDSYFC